MLVVQEAVDGKVFVAGRDNEGRPIMWLRSANEKTFDNKGPQSVPSHTPLAALGLPISSSMDLLSRKSSDAGLVSRSGNLVNLVYHLERAVAAVGDSGPDGKWLIIIDFNGYSMFNAPPLESTRHTIKILQVRANPLSPVHCRLSIPSFRRLWRLYLAGFCRC